MSNEIKVLELSGYINNPNKLMGSTLKSYNEIFENIYNNKDKFDDAVMDSWINENNQFAGVILDMTKMNMNQVKEYKIDSIVKDYSIKQCSVCGCHYFAHSLQTYRNNSGCVGTSFECVDCRILNNEAINEIIEVREKEGEIAAKKREFELLNS